MTSDLDWHASTFTKRTAVSVVWPAYSTQLGGSFPEQVHNVTLNNARAVVVQRIVNGMSPADWEAAEKAFDTSHEGVDDHAKDAPTKRAHLEMWLLRKFYESDAEGLVPDTELALQKVLDHHAHPAKVAAHRAQLLGSVTAAK